MELGTWQWGQKYSAHSLYEVHNGLICVTLAAIDIPILRGSTLASGEAEPCQFPQFIGY